MHFHMRCGTSLGYSVSLTRLCHVVLNTGNNNFTESRDRKTTPASLYAGASDPKTVSCTFVLNKEPLSRVVCSIL